jgi:hypothetical protein
MIIDQSQGSSINGFGHGKKPTKLGEGGCTYP